MDFRCRLPSPRIPVSDVLETRRIECPNCQRVMVQNVNQKKARCAICGNVWGWQRRRRGLVSLVRRAG